MPVNVEFNSSASTTTSLALDWSDVYEATGYEVTLTAVDDAADTQTETVATSDVVFTVAAGVEYNFKVRALYSDVQYNSDWAELDGVSTFIPQLAELTTKVVASDDEWAVVEWGSDDIDPSRVETFKIVLKDGNGDVITRYNNTFEFSVYNQLKYWGGKAERNRFYFGGLSANSTYTAEITHISPDAATYKDSEVSSVEFVTAAAYDKSEYLLWQDFDNHYMGGYSQYMAFGIDHKSSDSSIDFENLDSNTLWQIAVPIKNMDNIILNGTHKEDYHAMYMAGWDSSELVDSGFNTTIYLGGGALKFGTGSSAGKLTLPSFDITEPTDLTVQFDAMPYFEPNKTTGSLEFTPDQTDSKTFKIKVLEGAFEVDGTAYNAGDEVVLTNADATGADAAGHYSWTTHTITLKAATSATRVQIYTTKASKLYRMWLDNIKVKKAN